MIDRKDWSEFRTTGLVVVINQILHIFGWTIVFEMENDKVVDVFPARTKYRGFDSDTVDKSYKKISKYMLENAAELNNEANA